MSKQDFEKDIDKDQEDEEDNVIYLTDEEGNETPFECLMTFDHKDGTYASLIPVEPFEGIDEGEVLIMRVEEDGEEDCSFSPIETEEELEEVWDAFMELYDEEEPEEDDDTCEYEEEEAEDGEEE